MKKLCILLAVLMLAACVPEYQEPQNFIEKAKPTEEVTPVVNATGRVIPSPSKIVWQTRGNEKIMWGYDSAGRLVLLNSSAKTVVLDYNGDNLARIDDGVKPIQFFYDHEKLLSAEQGIRRWIFTYNSKGQMLTMEDGEKLVVFHDSKGRLSSVARNGGATTEFEYDKYNRTKTMYKSKIETDMYYDGDGRLAYMARQDDHLVLGYWRFDWISSISGTMYGLKETVSYGPTSITLISDNDQNDFESADPSDFETRFRAFNTFLFCTRFRKLPVLFDGQSWVLFHEYFKKGINDYLLTGFTCNALP